MCHKPATLSQRATWAELKRKESFPLRGKVRALQSGLVHKLRAQGRWGFVAKIVRLCLEVGRF